MSDLTALIKEGAAKLKVQASEGRISQLVEYIKLLAKWNKAYNLTAVRDPKEMVRRHLWDSFGVMGFLGETGSQLTGRDDTVLNLLDLGTGAGLPGIVIAILRPDINARRPVATDEGRGARG